MSTILVVDDAAVDRILVRKVLSRKPGLEIVEAENGEEAIGTLQTTQCDLVLTDLQMPVMGGLELVSWIKEQMPVIPTVLMTAQGSEKTAVEALLAGASSYVPKDNLITDLNGTVESVLAAAASKQAHQEILQRVVSSKTKFCIETRLPIVSALLDYLRQVISTTNGIPASEHVRVGVAVEEALLNAYYHGNLEVSSKLREGDEDTFHALANERIQKEPYCNRRITVEVVQETTSIAFQIRDEGQGFDVSALPDPTNPEFLSRPHGRGVMLMKTFFDDVQFNKTGNQVTMIRLFPQEQEAPAAEAE